MSGKELFVSELAELGYVPEDMGTNRVAIPYKIGAGRFAEREIKVAFEVQNDFNATCPTGPHLLPMLIPMKTDGTANDRAAPSPIGPEWQYLSRPYPGNGWSRTNRTVRRYMHYVRHILETL